MQSLIGRKGHRSLKEAKQAGERPLFGEVIALGKSPLPLARTLKTPDNGCWYLGPETSARGNRSDLGSRVVESHTPKAPTHLSTIYEEENATSHHLESGAVKPKQMFPGSLKNENAAPPQVERIV